MAHSLFATAPGNLEIGGRVYYVEAGQTLVLSDDEARLVLNGPSADKFKLVSSEVDMVNPLSIHSMGLPLISAASAPAPTITQHADWKTPPATGALPDPMVPPEQPYQDPDFFGQAPMLAPLEPAQLPDGATLAEPAIEVSKESPAIPDGTHWTKVKNHLTVLASQEVIDYGQVEDIKQRFAKYEVIQRACDEILANR